MGAEYSHPLRTPIPLALTVMIHVNQLSKTYGDVRAIREIGFRVSAGEVVGLLGPNGAGKTTTMRILCGCIGASSGTIEIDGIDLEREPKKAKAKIGYLPERPPLYDEMTVADFIAFAATVQDVDNPSEATDHALVQVGLNTNLGGQPVRDRIIGRLSKGYRQRVGLAAALVHNPEVLVLDEPTSGLDPAQRKELRSLVVSLAREANRTVLISTHILAEIEALCDRVIVINQGSLVAEDTIENLRTAASTVRLDIEGDAQELAQQLNALSDIHSVDVSVNGQLIITMSSDCRSEIARCAASFGLLEMTRTDGLEEIYLRLTQGDS